MKKPERKQKDSDASAGDDGAKRKTKRTTKRARDDRPATRRKAGEKRKRLNDALIVELRSLRADITQTADAFALRAGGRVAEMLQTLEGDESLDLAPRLLTVAEAQATLDELAADPTGPIEGRMRELRRIQRLVRGLRRRFRS